MLEKLKLESSAGIALLKGMMIVVTPNDIFHYELKQDGISVSKQQLLN